MAGKGIKKPIDIERPGKGKDKNKARTEHPRQAEADTAASRAATGASGPAPVGSNKDAAFKQGISVLSGSARRKG